MVVMPEDINAPEECDARGIEAAQGAIRKPQNPRKPTMVDI